MRRFFNLILLFSLVFLTSCSHFQSMSPETKRLNAFLEKEYNGRVNRYPQWQTYKGLKTNYNKLNNVSDKMSQEELEISKKALKQLLKFDYEKLDEQGKLSYRLYKQGLEEHIKDFNYRFHNYPISHMWGFHSSFVTFMSNMHLIDSESDAKAYISRIRAVKKQFDQQIINLKKRKELGIIPPRFTFKKINGTINNVLKGYPLTKDKKKPHVLWADFDKKMKPLKFSKEKRAALYKELESALSNEFKSAYTDLQKFLVTFKRASNNKAGVWKFPDGDRFYKIALRDYTTTDMTADEIHKIGLSEVKRIHKEMNEIKDKVGFKGSLKQFFKHLKTNDKFYYPDTEKGRQAYLDKTKEAIARIDKELPKLFATKYPSKLEVRRVEAYREKSAGRAFYNGPSPDGQKPGIYYVNLSDMKGLPKYELEALAFHEALPGHHMQISIAKGLDQLPSFRRYGGYTAYIEGWGLYSELLPHEIAVYSDDYSEFGRLSMELWRACRLVVDTGIHAKKWSRQRAISYLKKNTPNDIEEVKRSIDRYIVTPGQATAYKVGMLHILKLRKNAKEKLGKKFDIREFHDVILKNGPIPLSELEYLVNNWTNKKIN